MPLPTAGYTIRLDASDRELLWQEWGKSTHPNNAGEVRVWEDYADELDHSAWSEFEDSIVPPRYSTEGINGVPSLDFDGIVQYLRIRDDANGANRLLSTFITDSAFTMYIVLKAEGTGGTNATVYNNHKIIGDIGSFWGLFHEFIGGNERLAGYNWDGSADVAIQNISLNTVYVVMLRHESGSLYISVNNGAETSVSSGATTSLAAGVRIGGNVAANSWFNGKIGEIIIYNTALTGSNLNNTYQYLIEKWAGNSVPFMTHIDAHFM